jgi:hypothetical protein
MKFLSSILAYLTYGTGANDSTPGSREIFASPGWSELKWFYCGATLEFDHIVEVEVRDGGVATLL